MATAHAMRDRAAPAAAQSVAGARFAGSASADLIATQSALNATPRVQGLLSMQAALSQRAVPRARAEPNRTCLPDGLKPDIEAMSGLWMDTTRLHHSSGEPAELSAKPVVQGVLHVGDSVINDFATLDDEGIGGEEMRTAILGEIDEKDETAATTLLNMAVRTSDADVIRRGDKPQSREDREEQTRDLTARVTRELIRQVGRVRGGRRMGVLRAVDKFGMPQDVAETMIDHLGAPEVARLSDLIGKLWHSGRISLQKIIELLSDATLVGTGLGGFTELVDEYAGNPAALRLLGSLPAGEVAAMATDAEATNAFRARVDEVAGAVHEANALPNLRHRVELDAAGVIELSDEDRYQGLAEFTGELRDDLTLIMQDDEFNLRQDVQYIAGLEARFNRTASAPAGSGYGESEDAALLRAEIDRARKIYAHKINSISIMQNWRRYLDTQIAAIRRKAEQDVAALTGQRADIRDPAPYQPGPRTTRGFAMKYTRWAERAQAATEQQRARLTQRIADRRREMQAEFREAERRLFADVAQFFDMDAKFTDLMRQGLLLLPSDTRLAGIFPKRASVRLGPEDMHRESEILASHASNLMQNYGLFVGTTANGQKTGLIPAAREGCVCVMYLREGGGKKGITYRSVFGASGMDPYSVRAPRGDREAVEHKSYADMGVPAPQLETYSEAVNRLQGHLSQQKRLGIKLPSTQAELYFLQYPDYQATKAGGVHMIGLLESWGPSNCAEPAIMTAIYQMYHQPRDIHLSTPFEGRLGDDDKPQLKYTCARCAMAEPAFISPTNTEQGHRHTEMRLGRTMPRAPHMQLADKELVTNSANPSHPYDREGKHAAIEATAIQSASSGYAHVVGVRRKAAVVRKVQKRMAAELQQQRK